jgi:hypothetical protein
MRVTTSLIGLLVVCGIGVCSIGTAAAQPAGPPAGYKIDPEFTKTSPDGAITIEQYENKDTDDYKWQLFRYQAIMADTGSLGSYGVMQSILCWKVLWVDGFFGGLCMFARPHLEGFTGTQTWSAPRGWDTTTRNMLNLR